METSHRRKLSLVKMLCALSCMVAVFMLGACKKSDTTFVINELMAANKTGITASDGDTHDWIEIRNVSGHAANIGGYVLEKDSGKVRYELPEKELQPDECIIVYACKDSLKGDLCCGFNLSKGGDSIALVTPGGELECGVKYNRLKDDQALRRTKNDKYKKTYYQTPGFMNNEEGREEYFKMLEQQRKDPLKIWECQNKSLDDVHAKWIEVKNTSDKPVDMSTYAITSDRAKNLRVSLPKKQLAPGEIIAITDSMPELRGESYILLNNGKFADGICCGESYMGTSVGRMAKKEGFFFFASPTQGAENTTEGYRKVADKPEFSLKPGVYSQKSISLKLEGDKGAKIYYTLDGSLPTLKSPVFKDSLKIDTTTIVHAIAVDSARMVSSIATATYIIGEKHTLPVMCITLSHKDLYDYNSGIYVAGPGASSESPHLGANYWKRWEKCGHIEFFDGKDGFSYDCGVRIFGAYSRARDKKSFQIKFRYRYGHNKLRYDLYDTGEKDPVKAIVLRSGSQDDKKTMVRDEFFTSLMRQESPTLHIQAHRAIVLYVNGKYFGVYYIREKINEDYVANHLKVDPESATVLFGTGAPEVGSSTEYKQLVEYIRSHSMTDPEAYKYMKSQIDFASLIDYKIGEWYTGNCDVGNIRFFKSSDKKCDNKWYWLYYDLDWGFYYDTPLWFYIRENRSRASGGSLAGFNVFIDRLLKNPEFRTMFLEHWSHHRNKTFSEKNALAHFDKMIETIRPEMERNCKRWPACSYQGWQKNVEAFRERIKARPAQMDSYIQTELNPTAEEKKKYNI